MTSPPELSASRRLRPSELERLRLSLEIGARLLAQIAPDKSCHTCMSLRAGNKCATWETEVPLAALEAGCKKWEEDPPF
jgi:hypothetical protein